MKCLLSLIVILAVLSWVSGCSISDKTASEVKEYYIDEYSTQLYESVVEIKGPESSPISYVFLINMEGIIIEHPSLENNLDSIPNEKF